MKMSKWEKKFVNAQKHTSKGIEFADRMFKYVELKEKSDYLEIGCGIGAVTEHLSEKYRINATGIDVDPEQIEYARKHANSDNNIVFQVEDSVILPFDSDSFDIVLIHMVLHHIADWETAVREIHRVLRTGGSLILGDIVFSRFITKLFGFMKKKYGIAAYDELQEFILRSGFEKVYCAKVRSHLFPAINGVFAKVQS